MDAVEYKEDAFNTAKEKGEKLAKSVGYKLENVPCHSSFWMEGR